MHPYDIIFAGLALDIVGAVILAKGFILKIPQSAYYEALMIFGSNSHLLKSSILQRAEAQVGASLLVLGFLLQMWGNLHGGIAATEPGWVDSVARMLFIGMVAVAIAAGWLCLALSGARTTFYRIFFRNFSAQNMLKPQASDATWYHRWSLLLDIKRRYGESDEQLLARLEARRLGLGHRYGGQATDFLVVE